MPSKSVARLPDPAELSAKLLQLLDSDNDMSDSEDSSPGSTSPQALDIPRPLTLRMPTRMKPQESRIQVIPRIILTTPCGEEMDIDAAPSWRSVQLPAHLAHLMRRDKNSPQADDNTDGDANDGANGDANDGKEKSTPSEPTVTETTTDQRHSQIFRTLKDIRRKHPGISKKSWWNRSQER